MVELPVDNLAVILPSGKVSDPELYRHITARDLMTSLQSTCAFIG